jgi:hypothetical protein
MMARYVSLGQLSELSGLSASTLRRRIRDGSPQVFQPGGPGTRLLFRPDVLEIPLRSQDRAGSITDTHPSLSDAPNTLLPEDPVQSTLPGPQPQWFRKIPRKPLKMGVVPGEYLVTVSKKDYPPGMKRPDAHEMTMG